GGLPLRRRSIEELHAARRFCREEGATHCFFPYLNLLLYALGRSDGHAPGFGVSGILFSPGIRSELDRSRPVESLRLLGARVRKAGIVAWLLRSPVLTRVFVLNDRATVRTLNRLARRRPFRYLVDPVPPVPDGLEGASGLRETYGIPPERRIALLLGSLQRRKGVLEAVEAAARLPDDVASRTALVLAGRVDEEVTSELDAALADLRRRNPGLEVVLDDRYLTGEEVAVAFRDCDVILAPYQIRHDASSGVLSHAALHRKPVIVPSHDLIARLTREYALGIPTDVRDPEALARSLGRALSDPDRHVDPARMAAYVEERRPERFASTILDSLSVQAGREEGGRG
ncbi:MAG: glycosyltransferase, partial [Gemmatimonadota bacterium]